MAGSWRFCGELVADVWRDRQLPLSVPECLAAWQDPGSKPFSAPDSHILSLIASFAYDAVVIVAAFPRTMGLLGVLLTRIERLAELLSLWQLVIVVLTALVSLSILLNVLRQILFKNPNEPPVVFHLIPFIGSTITYGIEPFKFFFSCREKVRALSADLLHPAGVTMD